MTTLSAAYKALREKQQAKWLSTHKDLIQAPSVREETRKRAELTLKKKEMKQ